MAKKKQTPEQPVLVWAPTALRGNVRKWRLHACGCARMDFPRAGRKWLGFLELAERYADGTATKKEFDVGRSRFFTIHKPRFATQSGDFSLAFLDNRRLTDTWNSVVIQQRREYTSNESDYEIVLRRFHVLEDLVGPDPLPPFQPSWRTDVVMALARGAHEAREFSVMPILADALQDAGCDDPTILEHCRNPKQVHVRGCWVLDSILELTNRPRRGKRQGKPKSRGGS